MPRFFRWFPGKRRNKKAAAPNVAPASINNGEPVNPTEAAVRASAATSAAVASATKQLESDVDPLTKVQALARGNSERKRLALTKRQAGKLQAWARGNGERKRLAVAKLQAGTDATAPKHAGTGTLAKVQALARGNSERKRLALTKRQAGKLQARARGNGERKRLAVAKLQAGTDATATEHAGSGTLAKVQALARGNRERKRLALANLQAGKLQARARGNGERKRLAVAKLQAGTNATPTKQADTGTFSKLLGWTRGNRERKRPAKLQAETDATATKHVDVSTLTKVQALARGNSERKRLAGDHLQAGKLQARARGNGERKRLAEDKLLADTDSIPDDHEAALAHADGMVATVLGSAAEDLTQPPSSAPTLQGAAEPLVNLQPTVDAPKARGANLALASSADAANEQSRLAWLNHYLAAGQYDQARKSYRFDDIIYLIYQNRRLR